MADKACTIRVRKFITNRILERKQFVSSNPTIPSTLGRRCGRRGRSGCRKTRSGSRWERARLLARHGAWGQPGC
jgi:hypothetical protein